MVKSNRGQMVVEAILILVIFVGISTFVSTTFRNNELIAQMVSAPWQSLSGLLQNGVWAPPQAGSTLHPSHHLRHVSTRGRDGLR